jgi:hypothetical protein
MRDTIDMAETISHGWWLDDEKLKAFADLVRADEREQALAAPVQPVAWDRPIIYTPPHMAPPAAQRQWVGLTDEEVRKVNQEVWGYVSADHARMRGYARAIEAKLKEKNT